MDRNRLTATLVSGVLGGFAGAVFLAGFGALMSMSSFDAVVLAGGRARPQLVVTAGAMWFLSIILGMLGGIAIGVIAMAIGKTRTPDLATFPTTSLLAIAATSGALLTYVGLRMAVNMSGQIAEGLVTISAFRLIGSAMVVGASVGASVGWLTHALANPAFLGLEGAAWPKTKGEFLSASMKAMGAPIAALVILAVIAVPLSQILLTAAHEITGGAVIVGSIVAIIILAAASAAAYRPWDRTGA